jgi:hypothetical protein
MGLAFSSGHLLAFQRVTASSVGPPFTSVLQRDPEGAWTVFVNQDPALSCAPYFGSAIRRLVQVEIDLAWEGAGRLVVTVPEARLQWGLNLSADFTTRSLSWFAGALPVWLARRGWALGIAGEIGSRLLDSGELLLSGRTPNGHRFLTVPRAVWRVEAAAAVVEGGDLGVLDSLRDRVRLGDFLLPAQGLFVKGEAGFRASLLGQLHGTSGKERLPGRGRPDRTAAEFEEDDMIRHPR